MCSVNVAFDILRAMIPTEPINRKLSKIETLKLACGYINHLNAILAFGLVDNPCQYWGRQTGFSGICTFCVARFKVDVSLVPLNYLWQYLRTVSCWASFQFSLGLNNFQSRVFKLLIRDETIFCIDLEFLIWYNILFRKMFSRKCQLEFLFSIDYYFIAMYLSCMHDEFMP